MKFKEWLLGTPQKIFDLPAQEKGSTEGWLPVADIRNGVILLKDGRIVKILEVLPVLFDLKSDMEKENLIYYFASYLKIAPAHLQIRIVNRPADIRYYTKRMEGYEKDEPSETCRALIRDNIQEVEHLAQNEVLNIRIFLIFQLEPDMKLRGSTLEAAAERMYEEAQIARRYLDMCGLEVLEPQYEDNFQLELLYQLLNPNTSRSAPLPLHIFDAASTFAGITEEEMCRRAQEAADEDVQEAIASSPPDEGAEVEILPVVPAPAAEPESESPEEDGSSDIRIIDGAWTVAPIPRMPRRKRAKKPRHEKKPKVPQPVKTEKQKKHWRKREKKAKEVTPDYRPLQSGAVAVPDLLAPANIQREHKHFIIVDGVYHSYLYIAGYGYERVVSSGWLNPLVQMGDGVNMSFFISRQPKDRVLSKISQTTVFNRARMRDVDDTRQDFEELDSAITSGLFLKDQMNRNNEDFYYMSTLVEVTAPSAELLEQRLSDTKSYLASLGLISKDCDFRQEEAYLSCLPLLSLSPSLERKSRRNILTTSLAASFPFSSYQVNDMNGVIFGVNMQNNSLCCIDPFDDEKYENAGIAVFGRTGAGKTMLLQCLASRLREQNVRIFIVAPQKGFEYRPLCEKIGGAYIKLAPSSRDCINIMEIWRRTLDPDEELGRLSDRNDSLLADKISMLHAFFSLLKQDISEEDKNLLDAAFVECYAQFGITHDNASIFDADGNRKTMPTLCDLYRLLQSRPEVAHLAVLLTRFVNGSAKSLGGQTNVSLDNDYVVIDISDIGKDLQPIGALISISSCSDRCTENRLRRKFIMMDELWTLIGAGSNPQVAERVVQIAKLIRSYGAGFLNATQDLLDYFALEDGKYGKLILNACRIKIVLPLEEDEARLVQQKLNLSDAETLQIIRNRRGEGLLCIGQNRFSVAFRPTKLEYELITTSRKDLERIAAQNHRSSLAES